jgi:hypothetical protein
MYPGEARFSGRAAPHRLDERAERALGRRGSPVRMPPVTSSATRALLAASVAALCVFAAWNALYFLPYTVDDTYITLRYAWNFVHGQGLVFNPGERVEGYSNPSWTFFAAGALAAGWDGTMAVKYAGIALTVLMPAAAYLSARSLELNRPFALLCAGVAATDLNVAYWASEGLETPLWTLLLTIWIGAAAARLRGGGREFWSSLVGVALYLTRPEAPLFIAPVVLLEGWLAWKQPARRLAALRWAALLALPCISWLGFRYSYYGDWVANTYYVKATHTFKLAPLQSYAESYFLVASPIHTMLLVAAVPLVAFPGSGLGGIALAALLVQVVFVARAGGDWMPQNRFWVPAVPMVAFVVTSGAQAAGHLAARTLKQRGPLLAALGAAFGLGWQAWDHLGMDSAYIRDGAPLYVKRYEQGAKTWAERLEMPLWGGVPDRVLKILDYIPDDAVIAYSEIGLLGFVTENPIVDGLALIDRRLSGATHEKMEDVVASWAADPPDYLIVRDGVPILAAARKSDWYRAGGYGVRVRWHNTDVDAPGTGDLPELPVRQRLARLERAVERVPHELSFQRARIAAARELGDPARLADACAAFIAVFPRLAAECAGAPPVAGAGEATADAAPVGAAAAPVAPAGAAVTPAAPAAPVAADAVATAPATGQAFLPQSENGSFERLVDGAPAGWTSIPADAPGWQVVETGAHSGTRALEVRAPVLVCSGWRPVLGAIRVRGSVRTDGVAAGANANQAAAVSLRLKDAAGQQNFPVLHTWTGTQAWTPFDYAWTDVGSAAEYRACVGFTGGTGTAAFDDIEAGSGPPPGVLQVPVDGTFDAALTGWEAVPAASASIDGAGSATGTGALRVAKDGVVCGPWRKAPRTLRVAGKVRTAGAARGERAWQGPAVLVRSRGGADANQPVDVLTVFDETTAWAPFDATWTAHADRPEYRLCLGFSGGKGSLWFDDVVMTEVP